MSSKAREAEKRRQFYAECEERREKDAYFADIRSKLEELGIDPLMLKEYLDYVY